MKTGLLESQAKGIQQDKDGNASELMEAFRNLVVSVTVGPDDALEIAGRLEAVTGCEAVPHGMKLGVFCGVLPET